MYEILILIFLGGYWLTRYIVEDIQSMILIRRIIKHRIERH